MKPKYAIAVAAAAGITALGGTGALAATASHAPAARHCDKHALVLTPVSGKPGKVRPGHARAVRAKPVVVHPCPASGVVRAPGGDGTTR
jgi:hypothetical protein